MLLLEFNKADIETKGGRTFVTGPFMTADVVNKNNRLDPSMPGAFLTALRESVDELPEDQARIVYNLFGRDDFLHCEPTIPVDKTYLQNLEALPTDVAERLRALQAKDEVQMTKDGFAVV